MGYHLVSQKLLSFYRHLLGSAARALKHQPITSTWWGAIRTTVPDSPRPKRCRCLAAGRTGIRIVWSDSSFWITWGGFWDVYVKQHRQLHLCSAQWRVTSHPGNHRPAAVRFVTELWNIHTLQPSMTALHLSTVLNWCAGCVVVKAELSERGGREKRKEDVIHGVHVSVCDSLKVQPRWLPAWVR